MKRDSPLAYVLALALATIVIVVVLVTWGAPLGEIFGRMVAR